MNGYEKYLSSNKGRPSEVLELMHAEDRPMTTRELARRMASTLANMAKRMYSLEQAGIVWRDDKTTLIGATWRFSQPGDYQPPKAQIRFLGADCLQAMQKKVSARTRNETEIRSSGNRRPRR